VSRLRDLPCICGDGHHEFMTALWHRSFCRWYDHDRAGHQLRAAAWGWLADRLARFA
jgi:hypothetical protein